VLATPSTSRTFGPQTDVNDATWIAICLLRPDPLELRAARPIQELRDLTPHEAAFVREISQHSLRIQKTLEDANLSSAAYCRMCWAERPCDLAALIAERRNPEDSPIWPGLPEKSAPKLVEALRWTRHIIGIAERISASSSCAFGYTQASSSRWTRARYP